MQLRSVIIISALVFSASVYAQGTFVSVAGNGAGCSFVIENAVSGVATGTDGTTISSGSLPVLSLATDGIDNVVVDSVDSPAEVYTLDGRYVAADPENLEPGVYLVRRGSTTHKFIKSAR